MKTGRWTQVTTKYLRIVCHAELDDQGNWPVPYARGASQSMKARRISGNRFSGTASRASTLNPLGRRFSTQSITALASVNTSGDDISRVIDIYACPDESGEIILAAWVSFEEVQVFQSAHGERWLRDTMQNVNLEISTLKGERMSTCITRI